MSDRSEEFRFPLYLSMENPEPMYAQIETQLRDLILRGRLAPGTKIPSMRQLARELSCSVITTRRAYEDLEGEGYLITRQGFGTVVADVPEERIAAHFRETVESACEKFISTVRRAGMGDEDLYGILKEKLRAERGGVDWPDTGRSKP